MTITSIDNRDIIEALSRGFWARQETERLAPVKTMLASAMTAWNALVRGAYGSPEHPHYTQLLRAREAKDLDDILS